MKEFIFSSWTEKKKCTSSSSENWNENSHSPQCKDQCICSVCKIYFLKRRFGSQFKEMKEKRIVEYVT